MLLSEYVSYLVQQLAEHGDIVVTQYNETDGVEYEPNIIVHDPNLVDTAPQRQSLFQTFAKPKTRRTQEPKRLILS